MMQRWSASSSADDSDSSQDTRLRHDERLKRRQRVKRRTLTRSASSDTSSDFLPQTQTPFAPEKKEEKDSVEQEQKSSPFQWSPLKNAFRSLILSPKEPKPKPVAKSILRSPVMHVYVKGPSGLPTQRVPIGAARFTDFYSVQRSATLRALLLEP